jgi:hypothetical protein
MVVDRREYRFSVVAGDQRFVEITAQECALPAGAGPDAAGPERLGPDDGPERFGPDASGRDSIDSDAGSPASL